MTALELILTGLAFLAIAARTAMFLPRKPKQEVNQ